MAREIDNTMDGVILHFVLKIIAFAVRTATVTGAVLLIMRSIISSFFPVHTRIFLNPLFQFTEVFVRPVRHMLPEKICSHKADYTPLIAAIILLLLGLGMEEFLVSINTYFTVGVNEQVY